MQRRVIGVLKDIWATLSKELGGPAVNSLNMIGKNCRVESGSFCGNCNVKDVKNISEIEIHDSLREMNVEIHNAILESKCIKANLLNDEINVPESSRIIIENSGCIINSKEIDKSNIKVSDIFLNTPSAFSNNYSLKIQTLINSTKKIMEVPKKMKGTEGWMMDKSEIKRITDILKIKHPSWIISDYIIVAIFRKIPIKKIVNIKYFQEENILEVYFNDKSKDNSEADFLILKEKKTDRMEKLFI